MSFAFNWMPLLLAADEIVIRGTPAEWSALTLGGVLSLVGLIVFAYTTKAGIIARATTKEAVRQPIPHGDSAQRLGQLGRCDASNDADVRVGCALRIRFRDRSQRAPVPRFSDGGREPISFTRHRFQWAAEFLFQ